jgi:uncharacterized membrane protein (DUF2068 family)
MKLFLEHVIDFFITIFMLVSPLAIYDLLKTFTIEKSVLYIIAFLMMILLKLDLIGSQLNRIEKQTEK